MAYDNPHHIFENTIKGLIGIGDMYMWKRLKFAGGKFGKDEIAFKFDIPKPRKHSKQRRVEYFFDAFDGWQFRLDLVKNMIDCANALDQLGLVADGISDPNKWFVVEGINKNWVFFSSLIFLQKRGDKKAMFTSTVKYQHKAKEWPNSNKNGMVVEIVCFLYSLLRGRFDFKTIEKHQ